jgi:leader peptidase (prepilin peptidase) / N-methyltransferase
MQIFWPVVSAVFGLVVGSFLNVVINRLRLDESLGGRSECPNCKRQLQAKDLFPVLSFFLLKGKCRYCALPISWQYPIVELLTSVSFLLITVKVGEINVETFFLAVLASFFIVVGTYDFKHYLILDKVIFSGIAVAFAYALYRDFSQGCNFGFSTDCATMSGLAGAAVIAGFFYFQYLLSKGRWIGFGDVKYGMMLGMSVGFPLAIFLLFLGYMAGALVGSVLLATGAKDMASRLPFGTFLSYSAIMTLLYGKMAMSYYLYLIGMPPL